MLYPHVQKEAQAQLDKVVGVDRMPEAKDFEKLSYVRQIMKETLRCKIPYRLFSSLSMMCSCTEPSTAARFLSG